ncbi:MAG: hypothetical protein AB7O56_11120 [Bauldia sp.]
MTLVAAPDERADTGFSEVQRSLAAARRRRLSYALADAALLGAAVALGVYSALALLQLAVGSATPVAFSLIPPFPGIEGLAGSQLARFASVAIAAGIVAFIIRAAVASTKVPSVTAMARAADRILGTRERIATATELKARPRPQLSSIARVLVDDFDRTQGPLDVRRLVAATIPAWLPIGVALLAAVAVGLTAISEDPETAPPAPAVERAEIAAVAPETGEDIVEIAELIAADAERRDDPYLRALARELDALGAAIEANPEFDRALATRELARLLPLADDAYARTGVAEGVPENLARLVADAMADVAGMPRPALLAPAEEGGGGNAGGGAEGPAAGAGTPTPEIDLAAVGFDDVTDRIPRNLPDFPDNVLGAPMPGQIGPAEELDYAAQGRIEGAPQAGPEAANNPAEAPGGAAPAGAAANAGDAAGDAAGEGVQPLQDGTVTRFEDLPAPGDAMALPEAADGNGRRIRLDAPPDAAAIALAAGTRTDGAGWLHLPESAVARPLLPLAARDMLRGYFTAAGRETP